jgi:hypothetical protein
MPHPFAIIPRIRTYALHLIIAGLIGVSGIGCDASKNSTSGPAWTPAQQQLIDAWPTTTEGILKNLRSSVEIVNRLQPDRVVVAQIALTRDVPASEIILWFKEFPRSSFITFYLRAGKSGGGFYNFDPDARLQARMADPLAGGATHRQR